MRFFAACALLAGISGSAVAGVAFDDGTIGSSHLPVVGPFRVDGGYNPRGGAMVYDRSAQTSSRFNQPAAGAITFDDVPIPAATLGSNTQLDVCKVTVGIRQIAGAPTTDVSVFWTTISSTATAPDTLIDTPPTLLGTQNLGAAAASVTSLVTFGTSGGPTLFSVPLNTSVITGFGTFGLGVSLSDSTSTLNGWRITSGPAANADVFWIYDPSHVSQANDEGQYNFGGNPVAAFFIQVEGTPTPSPASLGLLGLGGLMITRRRR